MSPRRTRLLAVPLAGLTATVLLAGCADFPDSNPREWREKPELEAAGPQPRVPGDGPPGEPQPQPQQPAPSGPPGEPQGCVDPDPQVIATCLTSVTAIAVLPGGTSALVAERGTGRVLRVEQGQDPVEIAVLPADPTAVDGGVTGLALSPSYAEDELIYAYVTTVSDNRVVRIAPGGDPPKPVLTGIPRGETRNGGALAADGRGALLVATGDAGDPAGAAEASSLAGKVLRIDGFGAAAADNPDPSSRVLAGGLQNPGGLCVDPAVGTSWVTDRTDQRDVLHRLDTGAPAGQPPGGQPGTGPWGGPGTVLDSPAWTWPDRPGVAGCVAVPGLVAVALTTGKALFALRSGADGTFTGKPETAVKDVYGRLHAAAVGPDGLLWIGTVNKAGGTPVSSDDRVIRIQPPTAGGGGID
ncbi:MAG TPA: PQQ-dependent sugar dehydrogenase [Pseudonocardiaceae bacterium]